MINSKDLESLHFDTIDFIEQIPATYTGRVPQGFKFSAASTADIRSAVSNIVHDAKDAKHRPIERLIELDCNIPMSTYKQYMMGKGKPTRAFLCKICVGLGLSIEEANELLAMHSGELNMSNLSDAVTYYALKTHDLVEDYEQELEKYKNIYK